jgi:PKD repeat protein
VGTLVHFADLSTFGVDAATSGRTYNWSFGDEWYSPTTYSSTVGGTTHVYIANGIYSVNLTVNNTLAGDVEFKTNYITISNNQQQASVNWQPRSVAIQVLDANLVPIVGSPVYVNAYSSSLPGGLDGAVSYFKNAYGVTADVALSMFTSDTTYYGTTDDNGFIALQVVDVIQYRVITHDITGANTTRLFWPSGPYYQIVTSSAAIDGLAAQGRSQASINKNSTFNTTFWEPNTTYSCMGINVYDSTGQTNNVYAWWKLVDNGTYWWINSTSIGGYGPVNSSKCVLHIPYQQWKWGGVTG